MSVSSLANGLRRLTIVAAALLIGLVALSSTTPAQAQNPCVVTADATSRECTVNEAVTAVLISGWLCSTLPHPAGEFQGVRPELLNPAGLTVLPERVPDVTNPNRESFLRFQQQQAQRILADEGKPLDEIAGLWGWEFDLAAGTTVTLAPGETMEVEWSGCLTTAEFRKFVNFAVAAAKALLNR